MKKVFVLFVALAMGVAMSYAQEVQTQSPSNNDYAELVATDVDLSASPMEIKDVSFLSYFVRDEMNKELKSRNLNAIHEMVNAEY